MTALDASVGQSTQFPFTALAGDGTPQNITSGVVTMTVYLSPSNQTTPVLTKAGSVVSGPVGTATVSLAPTDTAPWGYRVLFYIVRVVVASATYVIDSGRLVVHP